MSLRLSTRSPRRRPSTPGRLTWPLPSFRDLDQVVVGIVALVLVGALVTGAFALGGLGLFEDRYQLSAVFKATGGIEKGATVRVAGVDVGSVTGIDPDFDRGQVIVSFEVDSGVELGPEARAEIASTTLLGGYHLKLEGPVDEPYLEDLDGDDPRRRIPLERTQAPVSLIDTLGEATDTIQAVDIDAVNEVLTELAGATERNKDVTPKLIESIGTVSAATAAREDELRRLIAGADTIGATLADRDEEILRLVDAATVLLDTLAARRDQLATILGSGSDAVAQLTDTLVTHRRAIEGILADSHTILDRVDANIGTINSGLAKGGPIFMLLGRVQNPRGGFDVAVEGFVGNTDQLRPLLGILFPQVNE